MAKIKEYGKLQGTCDSLWFTSMLKNTSFYLPAKCNYFRERKKTF